MIGLIIHNRIVVSHLIIVRLQSFQLLDHCDSFFDRFWYWPALLEHCGHRAR